MNILTEKITISLKPLRKRTVKWMLVLLLLGIDIWWGKKIYDLGQPTVWESATVVGVEPSLGKFTLLYDCGDYEEHSLSDYDKFVEKNKTYTIACISPKNRRLSNFLIFNLSILICLIGFNWGVIGGFLYKMWNKLPD
jgi:hypothetical protein